MFRRILWHKLYGVPEFNSVRCEVAPHAIRYGDPCLNHASLIHAFFQRSMSMTTLQNAYLHFYCDTALPPARRVGEVLRCLTMSGIKPTNNTLFTPPFIQVKYNILQFHKTVSAATAVLFSLCSYRFCLRQ